MAKWPCQTPLFSDPDNPSKELPLKVDSIPYGISNIELEQAYVIQAIDDVSALVLVLVLVSMISLQSYSSSVKSSSATLHN